MPTEHARNALRESFDRVATLYQQVRPDYPEALFDHLIKVTNLEAGAHLLEIGCATGKATMPLAKRGFNITCVELGSALAAVARQNMMGMPVDVIEQRFEDWHPGTGNGFDLVFAATAWHWIDPDVRYRKAWEILRSGGYLAFWTAAHVLPDGADPFFQQIQAVYDALGEGKQDANWRRPGEYPNSHDQIQASGLFEVVDIRSFDWERIYPVDEYIDLLNTFSDHILMEDQKRDILYREIRALLNQRSDQSVRHHWGAVLHVARRRDVPTSKEMSNLP